jgi:hypothetical protein
MLFDGAFLCCMTSWYFLCCMTSAMIMLVFLLKWRIFDHIPQCLTMVALLLQPHLLILCNVPSMLDDVVIGFRTIYYVHLY